MCEIFKKILDRVFKNEFDTQTQRCNHSFIEKCITGNAYIDEIDTYINNWHSDFNTENLMLYDYLGFSPNEYNEWLKNPDVLKDIIDSKIKIEEIYD